MEKSRGYIRFESGLGGVACVMHFVWGKSCWK